MSIFTPKISDDPFLVIDRIFQVFACLCCPFLNLYFFFFKSFMTPFYSLRILLSHASDNNTSQNIGGTDAWLGDQLSRIARDSPGMGKCPASRVGPFRDN